MKIIVLDHVLHFKTIGRKMHIGVDNEKPFRINSGDSLQLTHTLIDVDTFDVLKALIFKKPIEAKVRTNELGRI